MSKGVILAGGEGTRLRPMTTYVNKHLLPVYNKPMIFYPIETLVKAGITDVLVVIGGSQPDKFVPLLKDGKQFGLNSLTYMYQEGSGGIATALALAENFADGDPVAVILGDNCTDAEIYFNPDKNDDRARIFLKEVADPQRFGVARLNHSQSSPYTKAPVVEIVEKPQEYISDLAVTGLYFYPNDVFSFIRDLKPGKRGETEITDVNNWYLSQKRLDYSLLNGFWSDAGTPDSLVEVNKYWQNKNN
jgi:glucose-1-phosphate thymidylyltransferase